MFEEESTIPSDSLSLGKMKLVGGGWGAGENILQQYNSLKILRTSFLETLKKTYTSSPWDGFRTQVQ